MKIKSQDIRWIVKCVVLLGGVIFGIRHLWSAFGAWFVLRDDEPISLKIFMLMGPLSTLPASITAFFRPKIGSVWLICGSVLSFIVVMNGAFPKRDFEEIVLTYCAPMFVLGVLALFTINSRDLRNE